jgi:molybdopterin-guanine dinucleotide biosynthesis protein A
MLSLAILAGGRSERMGQDKALMPFLDHPLIERIIARLHPLADEIMLLANRPELYAYLGLPVHPDLAPGHGPLGGVHTALSLAAHPLVAILACDLPFASLALFEHERDLLVSTGADVVIPSTLTGLEPLHAVYRRDTCLPVIQKGMAAGENKVIAWLPRVKTHILAPDAIALFDPHQRVFWNLNTPEEFRQAEAIARLEAGL